MEHLERLNGIQYLLTDEADAIFNYLVLLVENINAIILHLKICLFMFAMLLRLTN